MSNKVPLLIFGAGNLARKSVAIAKQYFPEVAIVANVEWDTAWSDDRSTNIFEIARVAGVRAEQVATLEGLEEICDRLKPDLFLVIGSRWIFDSGFLARFNGRALNCHPSKLPAYRGGGGFSWQVLNNESHVHVSIHQLAAGIDSGPILVQKSHPLNISKPVPQDFHRASLHLGCDVIANALSILRSNGERDIPLTPQDHAGATYFPLLDASINGAIDFNWDVCQIELFIRAFSYPYSGAFAEYQGRRISVMEAEIRCDASFHPFCKGLVLNVSPGQASIACIGGVLTIKKARIGGADVDIGVTLRVGNRLYSALESVHEALTYRPDNKKFLLKVDVDSSRMDA